MIALIQRVLEARVTVAGNTVGEIGPGLLALVGRLRDDQADVPPREQLLSAGAGLMNLLNALHLMGYGAKVLSGASVDDLPVRDAFCREGETLLCWVVCGTPSACISSIEFCTMSALSIRSG